MKNTFVTTDLRNIGVDDNVCNKIMTISAGLEPAIFCSVGRRVIHCAMRPRWVVSCRMVNFWAFIYSQILRAQVYLMKTSEKHVTIMSNSSWDNTESRIFLYITDKRLQCYWLGVWHTLVILHLGGQVKECLEEGNPDYFQVMLNWRPH